MQQQQNMQWLTTRTYVLSYIKIRIPFPELSVPISFPWKIGAHFGRPVLIRVTHPRKASGSGTNRYPLATKQKLKKEPLGKIEKKGRVVGPPRGSKFSSLRTRPTYFPVPSRLPAPTKLPPSLLPKTKRGGPPTEPVPPFG